MNVVLPQPSDYVKALEANPQTVEDSVFSFPCNPWKMSHGNLCYFETLQFDQMG